eukprot:gnl/Chilomastix_cuspidata/3074.p1 GENE.gnl/Chilomastix_cuspidata/3074~~gnl/Chilomastix_cuspidata/3074.p1  ORF type:complete len:1214 (+),score=192.42 gnl/Chilomastix_cuspidata/3074:165-3644(+)
MVGGGSVFVLGLAFSYFDILSGNEVACIFPDNFSLPKPYSQDDFASLSLPEGAHTQPSQIIYHRFPALSNTQEEFYGVTDFRRHVSDKFRRDALFTATLLCLSVPAFKTACAAARTLHNACAPPTGWGERPDLPRIRAAFSAFHARANAVWRHPVLREPSFTVPVAEHSIPLSVPARGGAAYGTRPLLPLLRAVGAEAAVTIRNAILARRRVLFLSPSAEVSSACALAAPLLLLPLRGFGKYVAPCVPLAGAERLKALGARILGGVSPILSSFGRGLFDVLVRVRPAGTGFKRASVSATPDVPVVKRADKALTRALATGLRELRGESWLQECLAVANRELYAHAADKSRTGADRKQAKNFDAFLRHVPRLFSSPEFQDWVYGRPRGGVEYFRAAAGAQGAVRARTISKRLGAVSDIVLTKISDGEILLSDELELRRLLFESTQMFDTDGEARSVGLEPDRAALAVLLAATTRLYAPTASVAPPHVRPALATTPRLALSFALQLAEFAGFAPEETVSMLGFAHLARLCCSADGATARACARVLLEGLPRRPALLQLPGEGLREIYSYFAFVLCTRCATDLDEAAPAHVLSRMLEVSRGAEDAVCFSPYLLVAAAPLLLSPHPDTAAAVAALLDQMLFDIPAVYAAAEAVLHAPNGSTTASLLGFAAAAVAAAHRKYRDVVSVSDVVALLEGESDVRAALVQLADAEARAVAITPELFGQGLCLCPLDDYSSSFAHTVREAVLRATPGFGQRAAKLLRRHLADYPTLVALAALQPELSEPFVAPIARADTLPHDPYSSAFTQRDFTPRRGRGFAFLGQHGVAAPPFPTARAAPQTHPTALCPLYRVFTCACDSPPTDSEGKILLSLIEAVARTQIGAAAAHLLFVPFAAALEVLLYYDGSSTGARWVLAAAEALSGFPFEAPLTPPLAPFCLPAPPDLDVPRHASRLWVPCAAQAEAAAHLVVALLGRIAHANPSAEVCPGLAAVRNLVVYLLGAPWATLVPPRQLACSVSGSWAAVAERITRLCDGSPQNTRLRRDIDALLERGTARARTESNGVDDADTAVRLEATRAAHLGAYLDAWAEAEELSSSELALARQELLGNKTPRRTAQNSKRTSPMLSNTAALYSVSGDAVLAAPDLRTSVSVPLLSYRRYLNVNVDSLF